MENAGYSVYFFAVALVTLLIYGNNTWASPMVAVLNRWLRWILIAIGLAIFVQHMEWSARPFWVWVVSGFLSWFLLESIFNWLSVKALSQSPMPLFPRFVENSEGGEWPVQKRFIAVRDWLRDQRFEAVQALKSDLGIGVVLRSIVFRSADKKVRLQVIFVPRQSGVISEYFNFTSIAKDGIRLITDNLSIPFGGFYPANWRVARAIWTRGIERLHRTHRARMANHGGPFEELDGNPREDLNDEQRHIERINTEYGFLFPSHMHDEYGKITSEGRYRVWKEIWMMNYFGKSTSAGQKTPDEGGSL